MFTLSATPVTFVCLLVMFTVTSCWEVQRVVTARTGRVGHVLHLLMGLLMLAMVPRQLWIPLHRGVGIPVMMGVMLLGVVWFLVQAVRQWHDPVVRRHGLGCAGMFAAMVWHLWAMQVRMMHTMGPMASGAPMDHSMEAMGHGSMTMAPATDWLTTASSPGGVMWWFAVVGVLFMAGLAWMAVRDATLALRSREHRVGHVASLCMNLGMFWMSTGLLVPVLPFFAWLQF